MSWTPLPSMQLHQTHQSPMPWKREGQRLGGFDDTSCSHAFLMAREAGTGLTKWWAAPAEHAWLPWEQNQPQISLSLWLQPCKVTHLCLLPCLCLYGV